MLACALLCADLFASQATVEVDLAAPFADLFAGAQRHPDRSDEAVKGSLRYTDPSSGREVLIEQIDISVRGGTSRRDTECTFPKLKLRFAPGSVAKTMFEGVKTIKVGTHCDDRQDNDLTDRFGRWANEKSPQREAVVYRLLAALGIPTLRARPARIAYIDGGQRTVRRAFFLEDERDAMSRVGGVREIEPAAFRSAADQLSPDDAASIAFGEALIGNFDWCLEFTPDDRYRCDARRRLWNILAFARDDGPAVPIMYDFDLAGMVTGRHIWFDRVFYDRFEPGRSHPYLEVLGQIERTRSLFPRSLLDATRRRLLDRKAAALDALAAADLDPGGRKTIALYLRSFFEILERDDLFYAPAVVRSGEHVYLDADRTKPACGVHDTVPIGTVVGAPLETRGGMVRVPVLDTLWQWGPPERCDAIHQHPVWIAKAAISADYPRTKD